MGAPASLAGMVALERPPRWGLIAIVLLVLANAGLVLLLVQRQDQAPETSTSAAAATTAARSTTPTTAGTSTAPETSGDPGVLAVYGDGYSSGNSEGGTGAAGWPALVADQLGMQLQLSAATLAGYVNVGSTGQTYPQLVESAPVADAAVTVVFGSRNDADATPAQVQAAAEQTFAEIAAASPGTALLVIGPAWTGASPPAALTAVSAALRTAAEAAGGTYVDPLAEGWFADPTGLVSAADGISVLDAGHTYLAEQIAPLVEAALAD